MKGMVINMNEAKLTTIGQIRVFLSGTTEVAFNLPDAERYPFIERTLIRFSYRNLAKGDKGVVLRYMERVSGYSRQQLTRLVRRFSKDRQLNKRYHPPQKGFERHYNSADVTLLAKTDALHNQLSGPATRKLMERALTIYGDNRYCRLANISTAHLYNLRKQTDYQKKRRHWTKTRPTGVPIGIRRAPQPNGQPGFIRIDSVHQGDQDGVKGVYHVNAVDCVTQFEMVVTCERISEAYLMPAFKQLFEGFPFVIKGFHSDNGSEYVNRTVAALLEKLRIEFTKSRPRCSNDNALAESKNASVVRKHLGYAHIPQHHATQVNLFCLEYLNPYVNFHRPCFFPETITDAKGKERKCYRYEQMMTPYEKFKSLPNSAQYLKPNITFKQMDDMVKKISDNESADQLNKARSALFNAINKQSRNAA